MKRLLTMLLSVLLLCGCYNYSDIEKELFVAGIAFDLTKDSEGRELYLATAEVVTLTGGGESGEHSKTVQGAGYSMLGAINAVMSGSSKKLFFGHCKILAVSEEIAKRGLMNTLDLVFRDHEIRFSMNIVVARGCKAYELFEAYSVMDSIRAYEMAETIREASEKLGIAPFVHIYQMINSFNSPQSSAMAPAFTLRETVSGKPGYYLDGIAVFHGDSLKGYIESAACLYVLTAVGELKEGYVTCFIPSADEPFTVKITDSSVDMKTVINGDIPRAIINAELTLSLAEIPQEAYNKGMDMILDELSIFITRNIFTIVKDTINRYGTDIFGIGTSLMQQHPTFFEKHKEDWTDLLRTVVIDARVNVRVQNTGLSGSSSTGEAK